MTINEKTKAERKAEVLIRLSEFELPPVQDILLVGRQAPIGPEAARRMLDAVAPEQYELFLFDEGPVAAVAVRRRLLDICPRDRLLPLLVEEAKRLAPEYMVIKGKVQIDVVVERQVSLP
jgi:hypothetical protein